MHCCVVTFPKHDVIAVYVYVSLVDGSLYGDPVETPIQRLPEITRRKAASHPVTISVRIENDTELSEFHSSLIHNRSLGDPSLSKSRVNV